MKRYFFCVKIIFLILVAQNVVAAEALAIKTSKNLSQLSDVADSLDKKSQEAGKNQQASTKAAKATQQAHGEAALQIDRLRTNYQDFVSKNAKKVAAIQATHNLLEIQQELAPLISLRKKLAVLKNSDAQAAGLVEGELRVRSLADLDAKIATLTQQEKAAQKFLDEARGVASRPAQALKSPALVKNLADAIPLSVVTSEERASFVAETPGQLGEAEQADNEAKALQKRVEAVQEFKAVSSHGTGTTSLLAKDENEQLRDDLNNEEGLQEQFSVARGRAEATKNVAIKGGKKHRKIWQFIKDVLEKDAAASEMSPQQFTKMLAIVSGLLAIPIIAVVIVGILEGTGTISFAHKKSGPIESKVSIAKSASFTFYITLNNALGESWNILSTSSSLLSPVIDGGGRDINDHNNLFTYVRVTPFGKTGVASITFERIKKKTGQVLETRQYTITLIQ